MVEDYTKQGWTSRASGFPAARPGTCHQLNSTSFWAAWPQPQWCWVLLIGMKI